MNRIMMVPITFAVRISTTLVPNDMWTLLGVSQRNHARVGVPGTPGTLSSLEANHMIYPQNSRTANHLCHEPARAARFFDEYTLNVPLLADLTATGHL